MKSSVYATLGDLTEKLSMSILLWLGYDGELVCFALAEKY
jgi:hypothetical protein